MQTVWEGVLTPASVVKRIDLKAYVCSCEASHEQASPSVPVRSRSTTVLDLASPGQRWKCRDSSNKDDCEPKLKEANVTL